MLISSQPSAVVVIDVPWTVTYSDIQYADSAVDSDTTGAPLIYTQGLISFCTSFQFNPSSYSCMLVCCVKYAVAQGI